MHHLSLYLHFVRLRIRSQMEYRLSFLFDLFSQAGIAVIDFFMIALLFDRFKALAGWSLWEVGFLYGLIGICFPLAEMVGRGFDTFQRSVLRGDFDTMLIRPLGTFYQVFSHEFLLRRFGKIAQALVVFLIANAQLGVSWSFAKVAYLLLAMAGGTCFFIGLFVLGATLCFWTVQSIEVINIFTNGGVFMGSYPFSIYRSWFRRFFTFIVPLACVNYFPSLFLLDKIGVSGGSPLGVYLSPLAGVLFLGVGVLLWRWGVLHYQSTGH